MIISQRRYFFRYLITMLVLGTVIIMAVPIANDYIYHFPMVNEVCKTILICEVAVLLFVLLMKMAVNKGIKNLISKSRK